jgi:hypothetical protein
MFALTIEADDTTSVTTHPSREVAYAELVTFLESSGHPWRIAHASSTHSRFAIGEPSTGHAVIDELCACAHTEREYDESGCTVMEFQTGLSDASPQYE